MNLDAIALVLVLTPVVIFLWVLLGMFICDVWDELVRRWRKEP